MKNNTRFELSFKNITQLENKLNFCKLNNIKNINIPCKGLIKKDLFNSTFKYISKNYNEFNVTCLLYTSPSPRDGLLSRMPSSA